MPKSPSRGLDLGGGREAMTYLTSPSTPDYNCKTKITRMPPNSCLTAAVTSSLQLPHTEAKYPDLHIIELSILSVAQPIIRVRGVAPPQIK